MLGLRVGRQRATDPANGSVTVPAGQSFSLRPIEPLAAAAGIAWAARSTDGAVTLIAGDDVAMHLAYQ